MKKRKGDGKDLIEPQMLTLFFRIPKFVELPPVSEKSTNNNYFSEKY